MISLNYPGTLTLLVVGFATFITVSNARYGESNGLMSHFQTTNVTGPSCITPCEKRGQNYYWCYTNNITGSSGPGWPGWAHCSPAQGVTYQGEKCQTLCSTQKGYNYYWCYLDNESRRWNYCGPTYALDKYPLVTQFYTTYGEFCASHCSRDYKGFYFCDKVGGGRGPCSNWPNFDINGSKCKNDCGYGAERYSWCWLEKGGYNKCGLSSINSQTHFTFLGSICMSPCVWDTSASTNKCYDVTGYSRECSRVQGLAANNLKCVNECGTKFDGGGEKSWHGCYTSEDRKEWSKCSNIHNELDTCSRVRRHPDKRQCVDQNTMKKKQNLLKTKNAANVLNIVYEPDNFRVLVFEKQPREGKKEMKSNGQLRKDAKKCLDNWRRRGFTLTGSGTTIAEGDNVRLDRQDNDFTPSPTDRRRYLNLQIQINGVSRLGGSSTTIAEVQVPMRMLDPGTPADRERVVDCFLDSLENRYGVYIHNFTNAELDDDQPGPSNRRRHDEHLILGSNEEGIENTDFHEYGTQSDEIPIDNEYIEPYDQIDGLQNGYSNVNQLDTNNLRQTEDSREQLDIPNDGSDGNAYYILGEEEEYPGVNEENPIPPHWENYWNERITNKGENQVDMEEEEHYYENNPPQETIDGYQGYGETSYNHDGEQFGSYDNKETSEVDNDDDQMLEVSSIYEHSEETQNQKLTSADYVQEGNTYSTN